MAIIGFGNARLYIAALFLKDGYSVVSMIHRLWQCWTVFCSPFPQGWLFCCVYDLKSDPTRIQQTMDAELPRMLSGFTFGFHLHQYIVSEMHTMLKRFGVAASQCIDKQGVQSRS